MAHTPKISQMAVAPAEELIAATQNKKVSEINISADLADLSPLRLMSGQTLRSASDRHVSLSKILLEKAIKSPSSVGLRIPSTGLRKTVTIPFAILVRFTGGKVNCMQFMEDTFCTASSFRSGGK